MGYLDIYPNDKLFWVLDKQNKDAIPYLMNNDANKMKNLLTEEIYDGFDFHPTMDKDDKKIVCDLDLWDQIKKQFAEKGLITNKYTKILNTGCFLLIAYDTQGRSVKGLSGKDNYSYSEVKKIRSQMLKTFEKKDKKFATDEELHMICDF